MYMSMQIPEWLAAYEPQVPLESLVVEVNKIFHSFDAASYDFQHPEIHQQLPSIWAEMMTRLPHAGPWNILDLGCGTGFEADVVLRALCNQIVNLTVYDPSPEMIAICKTRLARFSQVTFSSRIEETQSYAPFNLLLTNSLLHHLPVVEQTIEGLLAGLTSDAVWLAGHEPSTRFYRNGRCLDLLQSFRSHRKYTKWLEWRNYATRLRLLLGWHPLTATANAAYGRRLFLKRPGAQVIDRIVDFHVAHSAEEVMHGRGLDIDILKASFQRDWTLRWEKTYSFLGSFRYAGVPNIWLQRAHQLELEFPRDGANCSMIWERNRGKATAPHVC
jgi:SAM-dependent methyltransferase